MKGRVGNRNGAGRGRAKGKAKAKGAQARGLRAASSTYRCTAAALKCAAPSRKSGARDARVETALMNRFERGGGEAVVEYLDANIRIVRPGGYVRCAVTGEQIPLDQLKYWSVERQEAYSSPEAVLKRLGMAHRR